MLVNISRLNKLEKFVVENVRIGKGGVDHELSLSNLCFLENAFNVQLNSPDLY